MCKQNIFLVKLINRDRRKKYSDYYGKFEEKTRRKRRTNWWNRTKKQNPNEIKQHQKTNQAKAKTATNDFETKRNNEFLSYRKHKQKTAYKLCLSQLNTLPQMLTSNTNKIKTRKQTNENKSGQ